MRALRVLNLFGNKSKVTEKYVCLFSKRVKKMHEILTYLYYLSSKFAKVKENCKILKLRPFEFLATYDGVIWAPWIKTGDI